MLYFYEKNRCLADKAQILKKVSRDRELGRKLAQSGKFDGLVAVLRAILLNPDVITLREGAF